MAVTFFTVPFNQAELGLEDISRVDWLVETNAPDGRVEYPADNYTFHAGAVHTFQGGVGELRFPTKAGALPEEFELKLTPLIYTTGGVRGPEARAPYYCPAPATTDPVPLSSLAATSSVPATWLSAATAQLQLLVDEAVIARDSALTARKVVNPSALGPWWAACAKRATQPARAVFLGSSTTAGSNATTPANRWVNRLITQLQGVYPSGGSETAVMTLSAGTAAPPTAPGIQGFNAGIAATTSATYCQPATLYGIGVLNPTLVVHMIGSNDSVPGAYFVPVDEYKANVLAAIDAMAPHRAHLLVHTYRRFGTSVTLAQWAAYGAALREIAEVRPNVAFLDLSGDYEQAYGTTDPLDLIDTDGVHQTDAGHAFMAETIAKYLGLAGVRGPQGGPGPQGEPGPQGLPGVNAVPAKSAVDAYNGELIDDEESETRARLNDAMVAKAPELGAPGAALVGQRKAIHGGIVPKPIRAPHLVVEDVYPNQHAPRSVVWAEPSGVMYATGSDQGGADRVLWKSTNHGRDWTYKSTLANAIGQSTFLKLATGTLLYYDGSTAIYRSTDDGVTFTKVHDLRTNTTIMGMNSWTEDGSGHVYYGEYQVTDTGFTEIRVYRSDDDGATFDTFHAFPGPATSDAARVRHVHAVQCDPLDSRRLYVTTGDSEAAAGIYRINSAGTALESVVKNSQLASLGTTLARSIGIMFFPTHLVWGVDATESPLIVRMARTQIGQASPVAEIVYRINATGWWVARAATDSTRWIMSASKEGATRIDHVQHLYALEDNGTTVVELGSLGQNSAANAGSIAAIGRPELWGEGGRMWLASYNNSREGGLPARYQFAARLAYGAGQIPLVAPPRTPLVLAWITAQSGVIPAMATSSPSVTFGFARSGSLRRRLVVHDWSLRRTTGAGVASLVIYNATTSTVLWESPQVGTTSSQRNTAPVRDGDPHILEFDLAGSTALEFRVKGSGAGGFEGIASITYGWAEATA